MTKNTKYISIRLQTMLTFTVLLLLAPHVDCNPLKIHINIKNLNPLPKEKALICGGKKCKTCTDSICRECNPGYGTSPDGGCYTCDVKKCVQCNGNKNYCNLCKSFYFYDPLSSLCNKCSLGCRSCLNQMICMECGFFFVMSFGPKGEELRKCHVSWKRLVYTALSVILPVLFFIWCMWYKFFSKATLQERQTIYEARKEKRRRKEGKFSRQSTKN